MRFRMLIKALASPRGRTTLALGIGRDTLFLLRKRVLLKPLPYRQPIAWLSPFFMGGNGRGVMGTADSWPATNAEGIRTSRRLFSILYLMPLTGFVVLK